MGPGLVEELVGKTDGPKAAMNPAQTVPGEGIDPVEIDRNDRESAAEDEFHHVLRPGLVFNDTAFAGSDALFLPGRHFSGREQAQGLSVGDVLEGGPDAADALRPARGEVVHRNESRPEVPHIGKQEGRQDLQVRTPAPDDGAQNQAVRPAEMMVRNRNEATFGRNVIQLGGGNIVGDTECLQNAFSIRRTLFVRIGSMGLVRLVQVQQAECDT